MNQMIALVYWSDLENMSIFSYTGIILFLLFGFWLYRKSRHSSKQVMMLAVFICLYFTIIYLTFEMFDSSVTYHAVGVISIAFMGFGGKGFYCK